MTDPVTVPFVSNVPGLVLPTLEGVLAVDTVVLAGCVDSELKVMFVVCVTGAVDASTSPSSVGSVP